MRLIVLNRLPYLGRKRGMRQAGRLQFVWLPDGEEDKKEAEDEGRKGPLAHVLFEHYSAPSGLDFGAERWSRDPSEHLEVLADSLAAYAAKLRKAYLSSHHNNDSPNNKARVHHVLVPWGDDFRFSLAGRAFAALETLKEFVEGRDGGRR